MNGNDIKTLNQYILEKILINKNSKYVNNQLYEKWKQLIPNLEYNKFYEIFSSYIKKFSDIIVYTTYDKANLLIKNGLDAFNIIPYKEITKHYNIAAEALNHKEISEIYMGSFDNLTITVKKNKNNLMTVSYTINDKIIAVIVIEWK